MASSDLCRGECFTQTEDGYMKRICNNQAKCTLQPCPSCHEKLPQRFLDCHGGRCMSCAVLEYAGIDSSDLTLCLRCHRKLVPIGTSRINGAAHEDWEERRMHKKCWLEDKRENEEVDHKEDS
jgi:hypothetical protein